MNIIIGPKQRKQMCACLIKIQLRGKEMKLLHEVLNRLQEQQLGAPEIS